jgi:hypothetical protein
MIAGIPEAALLPLPAWDLTQRNHFRFGYDGASFALRRHPAQRYWTSYAGCERRHDGFEGELEHALAAIAGRHGRVAIAGSGGPVGIAAALVAERLGLVARVVVVAIDGFASRAVPVALPVERHARSFDDFAVFALDFARKVGCSNAWTALAAFHAAHTELPLIADHGELRLVNNAIDERLGAEAGPPNLSLVDNEAFTALDRWLILERRPGIPQLLRWSPELIAAQLDSLPMRIWIGVALGGGAPAIRAWTNRHARGALWRRSFPAIVGGDTRAAWDDGPMRARMSALSRRMRRLNPGSSMQHYTPLHRLAARLGVDLGDGLGEGAALYGNVAGAPEATGAQA